MLIHNEPDNLYHSKRGLYLTSHLLIAAHRSQSEFIEDFRSPKSDSNALHFGRAAHVHLLENDRFASSYTVGGPVNPHSGKTYGTKSKKFQGWASGQLLPAITPEEMELIEAMSASVLRERAARQLLASGEAEVTGRCKIEGVPCQVRVDWLTPCWRIVDYKTTKSLATFSVDCEQYGYLVQQAFYRQCVREVTGHDCRCYLIACEKTPEAPSVVLELNPELLDQQEESNRAKIVEVRELFHRLREEKQCQQ